MTYVFRFVAAMTIINFLVLNHKKNYLYYTHCLVYGGVTPLVKLF